MTSSQFTAALTAANIRPSTRTAVRVTGDAGKGGYFQAYLCSPEAAE
jgi:hypothetical protein